MQFAYGFLADAVQTSNDGKFNVLGGGFESIFVREFPTAHPVMGLFVKIDVLPAECDKPHDLKIELWDPDGTLVQRLEGQFTASPSGDRLRQSHVQVAWGLLQTRFTAPGDYAFHVMVDGEHIGKVPLAVVQVSG